MIKSFGFILYDPKKFFSTVLLTFFFLPLSLVTIMKVDASAKSQVAPYNGGQQISKVFYPADGSTVTVTCSGAVIKQSPGGNAYREGWVNPSNINNYNSASDMTGQLVSGSSSPYSNNCPSTLSSTNTNNNSNNTSSSNNSHPPRENVTYVTNNYTQPTTSTQSSSQTTQTSSASTKTPSKLPSTGPGSAIALGGITTVVATIGHVFYQRLRYR